MDESDTYIDPSCPRSDAVEALLQDHLDLGDVFTFEEFFCLFGIFLSDQSAEDTLIVAPRLSACYATQRK